MKSRSRYLVILLSLLALPLEVASETYPVREAGREATAPAPRAGTKPLTFEEATRLLPRLAPGFDRAELLKACPEDLPGLVGLMSETPGKDFQREDVIGLMGAIGGKCALEALRAEEKRLGETGPQEARRLQGAFRNAVMAIEARQTLAALPLESMDAVARRRVIFDFLESGNPNLVDWAGNTVIAEGKETVDALIAVMRETPRPMLRRRGMGVLRALGRKEGFDRYFPVFEDMLLSDDEGVVMGAAEVLMETRDRRAAAILLRRLERDDHQVRIVGIALARMKEAGAMPVLLKKFETGRSAVMEEASSALLEFGPPASQAILDRLESLGDEAKRRLIIVLGVIGDEGAEQALRRYAASANPTLKLAAELALKTMEEHKPKGQPRSR